MLCASCTVCKDRFDSTSDDNEKFPVAVAACGHVFHSECIKKWMKRARTCPNCRGIVTLDKIFRVHFLIEDFESSFEETKTAKIRSKIDLKRVEITKVRQELQEIEIQRSELQRSIVDFKVKLDQIEAGYLHDEKLFKRKLQEFDEFQAQKVIDLASSENESNQTPTSRITRARTATGGSLATSRPMTRVQRHSPPTLRTSADGPSKSSTITKPPTNLAEGASGTSTGFRPRSPCKMRASNR